jgi:hypothetical protein
MGKKTLMLLQIIVLAIIPSLLFAQQAGQGQQKAPAAQKGESSLSNENLDLEGKNLDSIIKAYNEKIQGVIQRNKLMENKNIRIIPYQVDYDLGSDNIFIERHMFLRDAGGAKVTGEKRKSVRLFISGGSLAKVVTTVYERDYNAASEFTIEITDPSPLTDNTDDIIIKQFNKKVMTVNKTLADIKNTTAFPVRNDMKRDFYVPNLTYFYNIVLSIAETYSKNAKDTDSSVAEFLRASAGY